MAENPWLAINNQKAMQFQNIGNQAQLLQSQGDIAMKQAQLAGENPLQADLTPFMKLTDQWTGSSLNEAYKKPETMDDRIKKIKESADEAMKMSGQLNADQQAMLKMQIDEQLAKERLAINKLKASQASSGKVNCRIPGG